MPCSLRSGRAPARYRLPGGADPRRDL